MLLSVIIPLPNEDFGRPNKHFRTSLCSPNEDLGRRNKR
jgi:hypothetical protein